MPVWLNRHWSYAIKNNYTPLFSGNVITYPGPNSDPGLDKLSS